MLDRMETGIEMVEKSERGLLTRPCLCRRGRRIEHDSNTPAAAARAAQPLGQAGERKVPTAGADQGFDVQFTAETAFPPVFHPFATVVEAAHMHAPAQIQGLAKGFHHANEKRTKDSLRQLGGASLAWERPGKSMVV